MLLPSGLGILSLRTAPYAEIILWIYALNVKPTKPVLSPRNAPLLGDSVTMLSTFIAYPVG